MGEEDGLQLQASSPISRMASNAGRVLGGLAGFFQRPDVWRRHRDFTALFGQGAGPPRGLSRAPESSKPGKVAPCFQPPHATAMRGALRFCRGKDARFFLFFLPNLDHVPRVEPPLRARGGGGGRVGRSVWGTLPGRPMMASPGKSGFFAALLGPRNDHSSS